MDSLGTCADCGSDEELTYSCPQCDHDICETCYEEGDGTCTECGAVLNSIDEL